MNSNNIIEDINISSPAIAICSDGKCYDFTYALQVQGNYGIRTYLAQHNPQIDPINEIASFARISEMAYTFFKNYLPTGYHTLKVVMRSSVYDYDDGNYYTELWYGINH